MIWKTSYLWPRMLTLAVLSILPLMLLHAYTLHVEYQRAEAAAYRAVLSHVNLAAKTVDDAVDRVESQLRLIARQRQAERGDSPRCGSLLQSLVHENRLVLAFEIHTATGVVACATEDVKTPNVAGTAPWVADILSRHGLWLSPPFVVMVDSRSRQVARLALAVEDGATRSTEVVSAMLDLQALSDSLSPSALPAGSVLAVYDANNRILARTVDFSQWVGKRFSMPAVRIQETGTNIATGIGVDSVERLYARSPMQRAGLYVYAGVPTAAITGAPAGQIRRSVLVALLVLTAGLGLAAYWSSIVSRSLRQLAQAADKLASGLHVERIDAHLPGELGTLASQFNLMLEALQSRKEALQASQRKSLHLGQLNEALSQAAHAAARLHDPQQLCEHICRICVDTGQASMAWLSMDGSWVAMAAGGSARNGTQLSALQADGQGEGASGLGPRWQACGASGSVVVENDLALAACCDNIRPALLAQGVRSAAALPVTIEGRQAGQLVLYAEEPNFFDSDAVRLLQAICADLAFALEAQQTEKARQHAERALAQREQQLAGIIDMAMDAIITVDASERIVVFNRAAAVMFRVKPDDVIGSPLQRFMPQDMPAIKKHLRELHAGDNLEDPHSHGLALRLRGVRSDGEVFPIEAAVVRLGIGPELLLTLTLRDVTSFERAEAAQAAEARAEAASRAKTEFISHMSHELRTPLNAVLGFSQLLQANARKRLTAKELQQLDMIFLAGAQLRSLVDEALDLSRIEAGRLDLRMQDVDLCALAHELLLLLEPLAQEQGVRLLMPRETKFALHLHTDDKRLRQVMLNILSNAIKYNRRGGTVSVALREADDHVELEVADTGLGMSAEQLQALFEPFNRLGREDSGIEGTGIGMALTRRLVELLGGSLAVGSEEDMGTRVTVRLPCSRPQSDTSQPAAPAASNTDAPVASPLDVAELRGRILYVEDNPVNVILVEAMLERWRAVELVSAPDVETGVRLATAIQPDLVLLDMQLGTATGHEFLARVRSDSRTASLRVVALSASAMPGEVQAALQAGVIDYWTKPLDADKFQAGVRDLLATPRYFGK